MLQQCCCIYNIPLLRVFFFNYLVLLHSVNIPIDLEDRVDRVATKGRVFLLLHSRRRRRRVKFLLLPFSLFDEETPWRRRRTQSEE